MGSSNFNRLPERSYKMADVVAKVKRINDAIKQGKPPEGRCKHEATVRRGSYEPGSPCAGRLKEGPSRQATALLSRNGRKYGISFTVDVGSSVLKHPRL